MLTRSGIAAAALLLVAVGAARADEPPPHAPFRVMTYNVRQVNDSDTGAYAWSERAPGVIELIADNDPDVFGVQEASADAIRDALMGAFEDTYDVWRPPGGSPKMIFYRRERFEGGETGNQYLPNPYPEGDPCFPNAAARTAAWVVLKDRTSGRSYFVMNAHIAHAAACSAGREAAAQALRDIIAEHAAALPVVLFGDFNVDVQAAGAPDEDTFAIVESGGGTGPNLYRSERHTGATTASERTFNSAWKEPSSAAARIDYIFMSGGDMTTAAQAVDRREVNGISPSDHFAVLATVRHAIFAAGRIVDTQGDGDAPGTQLWFADVDGNGRADKISWNPGLDDGRVRIYLSDGAATFAVTVVDEPGASASSTLRRFFADIDGDGCADRIDHDPAAAPGQVRSALSRCDGHFAEDTTASDATGGAATRLYFADVDGDGCADRIAWDPDQSGGATRVARSRCDGAFDDEATSDDEGASTTPSAIFAFADVDGDGIADKLLWDLAAAEGRTQVFRGDGDGSFTFTGAHAGGTSGDPDSRFYFADVDGDARADKIFWRPDFREGRLQIYLADGDDDGFEPAPIMNNPGYSQSAATTFFFADVDGNGAADQIYWNPDVPDTRAYLALAGGAAPDDDGDADGDSDGDGEPDGEDPPTDGGGGCGCGAATGGSATWALLALGLLLRGGIRRPRRRWSSTCRRRACAPRRSRRCEPSCRCRPTPRR